MPSSYLPEIRKPHNKRYTRYLNIKLWDISVLIGNNDISQFSENADTYKPSIVCPVMKATHDI